MAHSRLPANEVKGMLAINAYKKRMKGGEVYPPFMFVDGAIQKLKS